MAEHTRSAQFGSSTAVAFARSPMTVSYHAANLHSYSGGRFILGLGSQIQPLIRRRFDLPWSAPADRMKEYVPARQAIWVADRVGFTVVGEDAPPDRYAELVDTLRSESRSVDQAVGDPAP